MTGLEPKGGSHSPAGARRHQERRGRLATIRAWAMRLSGMGPGLVGRVVAEHDAAGNEQAVDAVIGGSLDIGLRTIADHQNVAPGEAPSGNATRLCDGEIENRGIGLASHGHAAALLRIALGNRTAAQ